MGPDEFDKKVDQKLAADGWQPKSGGFEKFYGQLYLGKISIKYIENQTICLWKLSDETMHSVADGTEKTVELCKSKCDAAAKSRGA
jgi:hypothetical protein